MEEFRKQEKLLATKKEMARLKKILADLPNDKKKAAEGLIQEAAFMRSTLRELRDIIDEEGPLDTFTQGDYEYQREHPAVKTYNTMIQRYATVCKQLFDMLPDGKPKSEADELMEFVKKARR